MKLEPRRVEAFLRDPGTVRVVLLYGEDTGLIAERAWRLVRQVAGAADDPFRVVELDRDGHDRIVDEMASLPLTGGRRVVRIRQATDTCTDAVEAALASAALGLLVLEAPELPSRARLRAVVERAADAVAIGCYRADRAAVSQGIGALLKEHGVTIERSALAWLEQRLGVDRAATRSEAEKLALYVGNGGTVDLPAAQACVGDLAGLSLEDALFAATVGDVVSADRALALALAEGAHPVAVLRAALAHLHRLQRARLVIEAGAQPTEAARTLRPPLFFRREPAFVKALQVWPMALLAEAAAALWRDEAACKRTGAPAEAICWNAVIGLALRAAFAQAK
jgi:DNA polymerase-3 subunit delta